MELTYLFSVASFAESFLAIFGAFFVVTRFDFEGVFTAVATSSNKSGLPAATPIFISPDKSWVKSMCRIFSFVD